MKISAIAALCKAAKAILIIDHAQDGGAIVQWVGDGRALYPVYDMPYLTKESVFTLFDVPGDKRGEYSCHHIQHDELWRDVLEDGDQHELPAPLHWLSIVWEGDVYRQVVSTNGLMMFESQYVKPLRDAKDMLDFYERALPGGSRCIAVKAGMLLQAVIVPANIIDREFAEAAQRFADRCEAERIRKDELERQGARRGWQQTGMEEGGDE